MNASQRQPVFQQVTRLFTYIGASLALFLIILGSKLWLIHQYGSDLPFWDQWNAEAGDIFIPYFNRTLSFLDFFKPHNEHRLFFTRILTMGLMLINHQWDAQLQMVANAIIHSLSAVVLFLIMIRLIPKALDLAIPVIALVFSLPLSWENTLSGFNSQYYFLFIFSLLSIALLVLHKPLSKWWFAGLALAFAGIFTVASGFLSACAVFALMTLKLIRERSGWKAPVITLIACSAVIILGLSLTVTVEYHKIFRAHSITAFIAALGRNLAWPNITCPWLAVVNILPLALLGFFYMRTKEKNLKAEEMTLALGFWVLLQAAVTAYARCGDARLTGWRYMDILSIVMVVNAFSIVLLVTRYAHRTKTARAWSFMFTIWGTLCVFGLMSLTSLALSHFIPQKNYYSNQQITHVKAFIATDDIRHLEGKHGVEIPFPDPYYLANVLRNPEIRKILPVSVREPVSVLQQNTNDLAFVKNGVGPATPRPEPHDIAWGSYSERDFRAEGTFESVPIRPSSFPFLKFEVSGHLGLDYLSLKLVDLSGTDIKILKPSEPALSEWKTFFIRAPGDEFRIAACDDHHNRWFAFKEPREVGYWSWAAERLAKLGPLILFSGLLVGAFTWILLYLNNMKSQADSLHGGDNGQP